jgi:hypothetical protein
VGESLDRIKVFGLASDILRPPPQLHAVLMATHPVGEERQVEPDDYLRILVEVAADGSAVKHSLRNVTQPRHDGVLPDEARLADFSDRHGSIDRPFAAPRAGNCYDAERHAEHEGTHNVTRLVMGGDDVFVHEVRHLAGSSFRSLVWGSKPPAIGTGTMAWLSSLSGFSNGNREATGRMTTPIDQAKQFDGTIGDRKAE